MLEMLRFDLLSVLSAKACGFPQHRGSIGLIENPESGENFLLTTDAVGVGLHVETE
jgi:hypothetical protein